MTHSHDILFAAAGCAFFILSATHIQDWSTSSPRRSPYAIPVALGYLLLASACFWCAHH